MLWFMGRNGKYHTAPRCQRRPFEVGWAEEDGYKDVWSKLHENWSGILNHFLALLWPLLPQQTSLHLSYYLTCLCMVHWVYYYNIQWDRYPPECFTKWCTQTKVSEIVRRNQNWSWFVYTMHKQWSVVTTDQSRENGRQRPLADDYYWSVKTTKDVIVCAYHLPGLKDDSHRPKWKRWSV